MNTSTKTCEWGTCEEPTTHSVNEKYYCREHALMVMLGRTPETK